MRDFLGWIIILSLFFLFWGTPDVWDRLHERVMYELEVKDGIR
jgi:hypothetical protein